VLASNIIAGGGPEKMVISNISAGGLCGRSDFALARGDEVVVTLASIGAVPGVVAWSDGPRFGLAFRAPVDPLAVIPSHVHAEHTRRDAELRKAPFSGPSRKRASSGPA
jgi:hypothetical protein